MRSDKSKKGKKPYRGKALGSTAALNLMYLPVVVLFCMFLIYPFFKGVQYSLTNWNGYSQTFKYIGLKNYYRMFTDHDMLTVIYNTIVYGVGSTLFQNVFGLLFAMLLRSNSRLNSAARTLIYLPAIISSLIMGYIWYFILELNGGALNDILLLFHGEAVNALANPKASVWILTGINSFQFVGVSMIIYLAGLNNIPPEYLEAAAIDGATPFQVFRNVTLPMLAPSITISVVLNLIGGLKLYDVIIALTGGGPGYATCSLSTMMYQLYFGREDAGLATALGVLMFTMITLVSVIALVTLRKKEIANED